MHKSFLPFLLLLLVSSRASARNTGDGLVSGRVTGNDQPASFATVLLLRAADSSLVKGALSDTTGAFQFEHAAPGQYFVSVTLTGFEKYSTAVFTVDSLGKNVELGTLTLASKSLDEVTIAAQKPLFEMRAGVLIMNIENSIVAAGNTALDVLQRAPGVVVDKDGNVSLKGRAGVQMMIDDKPTYLKPAQLYAMLSSMPASSIEKIEIISNPSAKYDAAGTGGIINIRLKKNKRQGLNSTITLGIGQGVFPKHNAAVSLNYRNKQFNLFGMYAFDNSNHYQQFLLRRKFSSGVPSVYDQDVYALTSPLSHTFKSGMDYFIDSKSTIGFLVSGYSETENVTLTNHTLIKDGREQLQASVLSGGKEDHLYRNLSYNLNFKSNLDTNGCKIEANVDYSKFNNTENKYNHSQEFLASGAPVSDMLYLRNLSPSTYDVFSAKIDYTHPLKAATLEAGAKSSYVVLDNKVQFDTLSNGNWASDALRSNQYQYSEMIGAGYLNFSKQIKKVSLQAGVRAEQTISEGKSVLTGQTLKRSYLNFFPSLSMEQTINDKNMFSLNYSSRISRPAYEELNPSIVYVDPYSYVQGNPELRPAISHAVDFSHIYKQVFITTLSVARSSNESVEAFEQNDSTHVTRLINRNFDHSNFYGVTFTLALPVKEWWQTSTNVTGYYSDYIAQQFLGGNLNNHILGLQVNTENTFVLPKNFKLDLSATYRTPTVAGLFVLKQWYTVAAGCSKSFADNRWQLTVNVNDIFYSNSDRIKIKYVNQDLSIVANRDSRVVRLTATYNIGKGASVRRKGGSEEEKRRVKSGG